MDKRKAREKRDCWEAGVKVLKMNCLARIGYKGKGKQLLC